MLEVRPITLRQANAYVRENHRHNLPTAGHKFSIACYDDGRLCGVAIAGQPIARKLDDGLTIEIRRVCTDGTFNACSILYGACSRVAKAMGYRRVVTYTLISEPGTSLKASGFINDGEAGGVSWNMPSRPRQETQLTLFGEERKYPDEKKIRWVKKFVGGVIKIMMEMSPELTAQVLENALKHGKFNVPLRNAIENAIDHLTPVPSEIEGGSYSWHKVCGKCHGYLMAHWKFCPECGRGCS